MFGNQPHYPTAFKAIVVCYALVVLVAMGLRAYLTFENKRRDRSQNNESAVATASEGTDDELTDWNSPEFKYRINCTICDSEDARVSKSRAEDHRRLSLPSVWSNSFARQKCRTITTIPNSKLGLVKLLEKADEEMSIDFMDLPPELRCRIYEFHIASLEMPRRPAQPPITKVSRIKGVLEKFPGIHDQLRDYCEGCIVLEPDAAMELNGSTAPAASLHLLEPNLSTPFLTPDLYTDASQRAAQPGESSSEVHFTEIPFAKS
ncbi:uncharacterized protein MYCFIDRAFT_196061 [Pseudocercospora fijiensis CIRAD86]|uniref:Uncharacterized protein n=1 Tax=Pseudocercospora fijiensis (strain CIRAD86) TaxID=383855 RepID=M2Z659_PSEFD|nr:uncharacterized protein MYCFIDRAFT_196061 [Pseudocercospora fijiensis CIRAD86]EME85245.1 hypothetical protein MYCFIDRAFT_196061 [Pseudocercospora fijiensis CIRAD86]